MHPSDQQFFMHALQHAVHASNAAALQPPPQVAAGSSDAATGSRMEGGLRMDACMQQQPPSAAPQPGADLGSFAGVPLPPQALPPMRKSSASGSSSSSSSVAGGGCGAPLLQQQRPAPPLAANSSSSYDRIDNESELRDTRRTLDRVFLENTELVRQIEELEV